jgi:hypothetical protein
VIQTLFIVFLLIVAWGIADAVFKGQLGAEPELWR